MNEKSSFRFEFSLSGVSLQRATYQSTDMEIVIEGGQPAVLDIVFPSSSAKGAQHARRIADAVLRECCFRYVGHLDAISPPRQVGSLGTLALGMGVSSSVAKHDGRKLLEGVALRLLAGSPVFAADSDLAKDLFVFALQLPHSALRFVVLYSALMLFASFKKTQGTQSHVDRMLKAAGVAQAVPVAPTRGNNTRPQGETVYTRLRNELLHVEDRKRDLGKVLEEIEAECGTFQSLVAQILNW